MRLVFVSHFLFLSWWMTYDFLLSLEPCCHFASSAEADAASFTACLAAAASAFLAFPAAFFEFSPACFFGMMCCRVGVYVCVVALWRGG